MNAPLLERVRMCLAEVGISPDHAWVSDDDLIRTVDVPDAIAWRAVSLARMADGHRSPCWSCAQNAACGTAADVRAARSECEAVLPLTINCGRTR